MKFEIRSTRSETRRAFTLLEVLLALSLSVLVLAGVGSAIHIHLHMVDKGRVQVEEAQLARAILARIADDLRATVHYEPPDMSGIEAAAANSASSEALQAISGSRSSGQPRSGNSSGSSGASSGQSDTSSISSSVDPRTTPGVYGYQFEIQMDVSRLPRLDQYGSAPLGNDATGSSTALAATAPPSDLKTVAYYLRTEGPSGPAGLVRRSLDRAATLWASEQGTITDLDWQAELLAPEVIDLEFVYYDGTTTYTEWNSADQGGLPLAVEIILTLANSEAAANPTYPDDGVMYRLLVCLPAAQSKKTSSTTTPSDTSSSSETPSQDSETEEP